MFGRSLLIVSVAVALTACRGESPEGQMAKAQEFIKSRDYSSATIALRALLQKDPKHAQARFALGRALLDSGDSQSAEKELRRAEELGIPVDQTAPLIARCVAEQGSYDKLIEEFSSKTYSDSSTTASVRADVASALLERGKVDEAKAAASYVLTLVPGHPRARFVAAKATLVSGDRSGALGELQSIIHDSPEFWEAEMLVGSLAAEDNRLDDAVQHYRNAVKVNPNGLMPRFQLALVLLRSNLLADAQEQIKQLQRTAGRHPLVYYLQALVQHEQKDLNAARASIQQTLKAMPAFVPGLMAAGRIESELGNHNLARQHLQKVLEIRPGSISAQRQLVVEMLSGNENAAALDAAATLLQLAPNDPDELMLAAEVNRRNGRHSEAVRLSQRAAELDPKNAKRRANLAMNLLAGGNTAEAIRELTQASTADPNDYKADAMLVATYLSRGQYPKALDAVAILERKQPNNVLPHNLRGSIYAAMGEKDKARSSFEKAVSIDATNIRAVASLAKLDIQDKDLDRAKKRFEAILAKDNRNYRAMIALASVLEEGGAAPIERQKVLERALAASPNTSETRVALIQHYAKLGDWRNANIAAKEAYSALPDKVAILELLAVTQRQVGEANQALASLEKLVAMRPDALRPLLLLAELQSAESAGEAALKTYAKAVALSPSSVEARRGQALANVALGRFDDALRVVAELKTAQPKLSVGDVLEGDIYSAQRKWEDAARAFQTAQAKDKSALVNAKLHSALAQAGRLPDAAALAGEYVRNNPQDIFFRNYLAEFNLRRGNLEEASKNYQAAIAIDSTNLLALNNYAWIRHQLKDPKAVEYAERAEKIAPMNASVLDTLGWILVDRGETSRGIGKLRQATEASPMFHQVRMHLAQALIKAGDKQAARKELQSLSKLDDGHASIRAEANKLLADL